MDWEDIVVTIQEGCVTGVLVNSAKIPKGVTVSLVDYDNQDDETDKYQGYERDLSRLVATGEYRDIL